MYKEVGEQRWQHSQLLYGHASPHARTLKTLLNATNTPLRLTVAAPYAKESHIMITPFRAQVSNG